jgi:putative flippase GtrA
MEHATSYTRIISRFSKYGLVGVSTYLLDIGIITALMHFFDANQMLAIACGFLVGISINYYFEYRWVFKGTERGEVPGYLIFSIIGLCGLLFIMYSTEVLVEMLDLPLLVARTITGSLLGIFGFFFNALCNFKLL